MPVEINLLSRTAKNSKRYLYVLTGIVLSVLSAAVGMNWYGNHVTETAADYEQKHQELEIRSGELESELSDLRDSEAEKLESMISTLEEEKVVPASVIIDELVTDMPEQGYMTLFDYSFPGEVYLEYAFSDLVDLASYHRRLEDSAMVNDVTMESVTGEEIEETTDSSSDDYLPRYYTYFHITLNQDAIRDDAEEAEEEAL